MPPSHVISVFFLSVCFTSGRGQSLVRLTRFHDDLGREIGLLKCQLAFSNVLMQFYFAGTAVLIYFCGVFSRGKLSVFGGLDTAE